MLVHGHDVDSVKGRGALGTETTLDGVLDGEEDDLVRDYVYGSGFGCLEEGVHAVLPLGDAPRLGVAEIPDTAADDCQSRDAASDATREGAVEESGGASAVKEGVPEEGELDPTDSDGPVRVLLAIGVDVLVDVLYGSVWSCGSALPGFCCNPIMEKDSYRRPGERWNRR